MGSMAKFTVDSAEVESTACDAMQTSRALNLLLKIFPPRSESGELLSDRYRPSNPWWKIVNFQNEPVGLVMRGSPPAFQITAENFSAA